MRIATTVALSLTVAAPRLVLAGEPDEPAPARRAGGDAGPAQFTLMEARSAVDAHLARATREAGGVYRVADDRAGGVLELELVRVGIVSASSLWSVHDAERHVGRDTFFACALLHAVGAPREKEYDVDMLIEPRDGALVVTDVRIHKEKLLVDGKWVWETRPPRPDGAAGGGR